MKADTPAGEDIRKKAFAILRRELSRGEFVRFLQSLYSGKGDYTAERQAIIGDITIEEVIAGIEARRKPLENREARN